MRPLLTLFLFFSVLSCNLRAQITVLDDFDRIFQNSLTWVHSEPNSMFSPNTCDFYGWTANLYDLRPTASLQRNPIIGVTGDSMIISFKHYVVDFGSTTDAPPIGYGQLTLSYSIDDGTSFLPLIQVTDAGPVCSTYQTSIPAGILEEGMEVIIRFDIEHYTGDWLSYMDDFFAVQPGGCITPEVSYMISGDCSDGDFYVTAMLDEIGFVNSLTINDNMGSPPQTLNTSGTSVSFGPYSPGTVIGFNVFDPQNLDCSSDRNLYIGACPPVNDNCIDAEIIRCNDGWVTGTLAGATGYEEPLECITNPQVWYYFIGTGFDHTITGAGADNYPVRMLVAEESCDDLTTIVCVEPSTSTQCAITTIPTVEGQRYLIAIEWSDDRYVNILDGEIIGVLLECQGCHQPSANYAIVPNCNESQYYIDLTVSSLGDANSVVASDDQSSAIQFANDPNTLLRFGPYESGESIEIKVADRVNGSCFIALEVPAFICPPSNDNCTTALPLTCQSGPVRGTTIGANSSEVNDKCSDNFDVWYAFTGTGNTMRLIVDPVSTSFDLGLTVYTGTCEAPVLVDCNVDFGFDQIDTLDINTINGEQYYVMVAGWFLIPSRSRAFDLELKCLDCFMPEIVFETVEDCDNLQYSVHARVDDLGSTGSLTIFDDLGGNPQSVSTNGTSLIFGPYSTNVSFSFSIEGEVVEDCKMPTTLVIPSCPLINESCNSAIALVNDQGLPTAANGQWYRTVDTLTFDDQAKGGTWFTITVPPGRSYTPTILVESKPSHNAKILLYENYCERLKLIAEQNQQPPGEIETFSYSFPINESESSRTYYLNVVNDSSVDFGLFRITVLVNLPVELRQFSGNAQLKINHLNWITEREEDLSHFVIERKINTASNWQDIGRVEKNESTNNSAQSYEFFDLEPTPRAWYRLRMIDDDNGYTMSNIVVVHNAKAAITTLEVFPNPSNGWLNAVVRGEELEGGKWQLVDLHGRVYMESKLTGNRNDLIGEINLHHAPIGVYLFRININGEWMQRRIILR